MSCTEKGTVITSFINMKICFVWFTAEFGNSFREKIQDITLIHLIIIPFSWEYEGNSFVFEFKTCILKSGIYESFLCLDTRKPRSKWKWLCIFWSFCDYWGFFFWTWFFRGYFRGFFFFWRWSAYFYFRSWCSLLLRNSCRSGDISLWCFYNWFRSFCESYKREFKKERWIRSWFQLSISIFDTFKYSIVLPEWRRIEICIYSILQKEEELFEEEAYIDITFLKFPESSNHGRYISFDYEL